MAKYTAYVGNCLTNEDFFQENNSNCNNIDFKAKNLKNSKAKVKNKNFIKSTRLLVDSPTKMANYQSLKK